MRIRILFQKLVSFVLVISAGSSLSAIGQTPKGGRVAAKSSATAAAKCSGAWTGNITYTRTQTMNDNKTVQRVSNRGKDTTKWEMRYNYVASVGVVESPERNGSSIGRASIDHTMT